jgi:hypothetical protein
MQPPSTPSTGAATDEASIKRAERLQRMSERRKAKRLAQQEDVLSVLKIIDDLPEE